MPKYRVDVLSKTIDSEYFGTYASSLFYAKEKKEPKNTVFVLINLGSKSYYAIKEIY